MTEASPITWTTPITWTRPSYTNEMMVLRLRYGYPVASSVLCIMGTFTNSVSLTYFIKKQDKTIGDKLLTLLNSSDLLLCFFATTISILTSFIVGTGGSEPDTIAPVFLVIIFILYVVLVDGTAYATCLLSVTRAITIALPFYRIKGKSLVIIGIIV